MTKKKPIMSLSIDLEVQDKLKLAAKQQTKGNVSKLVRKLVDKFLVMDEDVIPVFLKIPAELKGDESGLKSWLEIKTTALAKVLSK